MCRVVVHGLAYFDLCKRCCVVVSGLQSTGLVDSTKVSGPPGYSLGLYVPEDPRSTDDLGTIMTNGRTLSVATMASYSCRPDTTSSVDCISNSPEHREGRWHVDSRLLLA